MKKVTTLLVAFLFTAGMAFAQSNEATIDQVGNDNNSEVEQSSASTVSVTQVGNSNNAFALHGGNGTIEQVQLGNSNAADVYGGDNSSLDQFQRGNDNRALIGVTRNALIQGSTASQFQDGNRNFAELEVRQGNGRNNSFVQSQTGNDNRARVLDIGNGNSVDQVQVGNDNRSIVGTMLDPQLGDMTVNTTQLGNDNRAFVNGDGNELADIFQRGNTNFADITQLGQDMDSSVIFQDGNRNNATILQDVN